MPRRVRRPKVRVTVTRGMLAQLRTGHDFFGDGFGNKDPDRAAMLSAWKDNREAILEETARRKGPGHRPWAFWQFDAPEPRNESEDEIAQLDRFGLLSDEERVELQLCEEMEK